MNAYVIVSAALGIYLILVYLLGSVLGLEGNDLWILRGLMALLGIIAAISYLVYYIRVLKPARSSKKGDSGGSGEGGKGEINQVLREAESRLATSADRKAKLANRPLLLILGKPGTAKTSTLVHCGLDPDLLAGHVYRDNAIAPTPTANLWYARQSVFVEAGGRVVSQETEWQRLAKKLRPGSLGSVFGAGRDAPRAALVCVSCDDFMQGGAEEALAATARDLRARLEEASRTMGVRLPVYVLFTKSDRIAFFAEYVRNLESTETGQVLGVTLPAGSDEGIYAERQSALLADEFNRLIYRLCDRRTEFLGREQDDTPLGGIYEFPRELRKLRSNLVQFLVDLCRPSQLQAGPFLRGWYFSGVRAIMTREAPQAPRAADQGPRDIRQATSVFTAGESAGRAAPAEPTIRKKPQWIFLAHLFQDVLLQDGLGARGGGSSLKTNRLRRVLLAAAAMLCVVWMVGMVVSYFGNRGLEAQAREAVQGIEQTQLSGTEFAPLGALTDLETLRQTLETLTRYEFDGAPWRLRWGLYSGDDLYPVVRRVYYDRFHQLLFGATQASLVGTLQRLPSTPTPADQYGPIYDTLKAYLITTSHPDKSTREFLTPVLMDHATRNRQVDEERLELARQQFDFYAGDLTNSNPYSSQHDTPAVDRGRNYLSQFAGVERVYQFMIAEASRRNPSVNFNRMFQGSEAVVVNNREVPGAFTKDGWTFMQDAMKNADRFFGGEEWVLGPQAGAGIDPAKLEQELGTRYRRDFIDQWRAYLGDTTVVRYRSLSDAAAKLGTVSGNQSPLLAALWLASRNTAVDDEQIKTIFQPVQYVVPPESEDRYVSDPNAGYMQALLGLQASVEQTAGASPASRDAYVDQVNTQASQAKVVTRQVAQNFSVNPGTSVDGDVQQLMERPILYAEALVRSLGPAELNAKGRALCNQFQAVMRKYPFRPDAANEATLNEVAALFAPGTGAIWTFYEEDLREHLTRQGFRYTPNPSGRIRLNAAFVDFFNRAVQFSEAIYPAGSREPRLVYQLTGHPAEGIRALRLRVGNQILTVQGQPAAVAFQWPGSGNQPVSLTGQFGGGAELTFTSYEGLWAIFRFFGDADRWQTAGNTDRLEWVLRQGRAGRPLTLSDGRPLTVRFDLESAAPVFRKEFLAGLACVSQVAR